MKKFFSATWKTIITCLVIAGLITAFIDFTSKMEVEQLAKDIVIMVVILFIIVIFRFFYEE